MATPHHLARSRRRCRAAETASAARAAPSHPAPATPGSRLLHKPARRSLRRAVWRNPRVCPQPLWSWWRANPGSTAARQPGMRTARSSAVAACSPSARSSQPARPLARRTLWRIPRDTSPTDVAAACRCARTRLQLHTTTMWRASCVRTDTPCILVLRATLSSPPPTDYHRNSERTW